MDRVILEVIDEIIWVKREDYEKLRGEIDSLIIIKEWFSDEYVIRTNLVEETDNTNKLLYVYIDRRGKELEIEFGLDDQLNLINVRLIEDEELVETKDMFDAFFQMRSKFK